MWMNIHDVEDFKIHHVGKFIDDKGEVYYTIWIVISDNHTTYNITLYTNDLTPFKSYMKLPPIQVGVKV